MAENDDEDTGSPIAGAQNRRSTPPSDFWSESETAVLIEAWGERYIGLSRGSLKQIHWGEVAKIVSESEGKTAKTHVQCKYRIDTVKKRYKSEKAKSDDGHPSNWPFFNRLHQLLNPNPLPQRKRPRPIVVDSESESPPRRSLHDLTKAILKFGEAYEKTETAKLQGMVEMEKERMKFAKEIEVERMKFLVKTQVEIEEIRRGALPVGAGDDNHTDINGADQSNVNSVTNTTD